MIIKYIADDGTEFANEWDCELYEEAENMKASYSDIFKIEFWDKENNKYNISPDDVFAENIYNNAVKLRIPSEDAFKGFHVWAKYCGWCEFEDEILGPGIWERYEKEYMNHVWTRKSI